VEHDLAIRMNVAIESALTGKVQSNQPVNIGAWLTEGSPLPAFGMESWQLASKSVVTSENDYKTATIE